MEVFQASLPTKHRGTVHRKSRRTVRSRGIYIYIYIYIFIYLLLIALHSWVQVALIHLNNHHAAEQSFRHIAKEVREDCIKHRVRVFFGDGNKKAYSFEDFFRTGYKEKPSSQPCSSHRGPDGQSSSSASSLVQSGLPLESKMVASHVEWGQEIRSRQLRLVPDEKKLLYDSMFIMILGPHQQLRSLGPFRHCLLGAYWPREATDIEGKEKCVTVGYDAETYADGHGTAPVADMQPDDYPDHVNFFQKLRTIVAHSKNTPVTDSHGCLVRKIQDEKVWRWIELTKQDLPDAWIPAYHKDGMKNHESRASGPTACSEWSTFSHVREMLADPDKCDPSGQFCGRGAHCPLHVKVRGCEIEGPADPDAKVTRSNKRPPEAQDKRQVRDSKKRIWNKSGFWPWWKFHHSERTLYTEEGENARYGIKWRYSRDDWLGRGNSEKDLYEWDKGWIKLYGQEAYEKSLKFTQIGYDLAKKRWPTYQRSQFMCIYIYIHTYIYIYIYISLLREAAESLPSKASLPSKSSKQVFQTSLPSKCLVGRLA